MRFDMRLDRLKAMTRHQKTAILAGVDGGMAIVCLIAAQVLTQGPEGAAVSRAAFGAEFGIALAAVALAALGLSVALGFAPQTLNDFETRGQARLGALTLALAVPLIGSALMGGVIGTATAVAFALVFWGASVMGRLALRGATTRIYQAKTTRARVLIYGAGQTGRQLAAALATDDKLIPVGFVDDNPTLHTVRLAGLPVHGPAALPHLVASRNIDRILLTMPSVSPARRAQITAELRGVGCPVYAIPAFAQLSASDLTSPSSAESLGGANQFLGRPALDPIFPCSANAFRGRRILVTGAGGSIGSELCRQVLANDPASVVLVDHCELALFNSHRQLCDTARDTIGDLPVHPVLGSVCDAGLMAQVLADYEIDVVLHAAAYKHVSLVEQNIVVGVTNNVLGTRTLAEAAREAGVERFILISSDKAVRPANAMGATKRLAELVVQTLAKGGGRTRFAIVRFGNVLGSSGSVIPIFAEQIARGGPVTVTHPQVKRYFMTVEEATRLVLLAGATAQGGEVFVLDMGAPVPIADLARQMICAAGLRVRDKDCPDGDVEIALTGLRPGEKLQEELFITGDGLPTSHAKILRVQENGLSELETARLLADLRTTTQARDADAVKAVLDQWVEPQTTAFSIAGE